MNKRLNVLMVYPEIAPFVKTNDIAEVGSDLPRVLKDTGHDVRLITPQYRVINERKYILRDVIRLQNIKVALGEELVEINVKSAFVPESKVQVYFIDYKPFFSRNGVYNDPDTGKLFSDNAERFILFSRGILETLKKLQWQPDVIHCNGWQTGLIPLFLKTIYSEESFFQSVSTMFTIHDMGEAGLFPPSCIDMMALKDNDEVVRDLVSSKKFSFLKAGIAFSDKINTVSEGLYELLISDKKDPGGIGNLLKKKNGSLPVIAPGAGTEIWEPATDKLISKPFSAINYSDRSENRGTLIETLNISLEKDVPIIMIYEEDSGLDFVEFMVRNIEKVSKLAAYILFVCKSEHYIEMVSNAIKPAFRNVAVVKAVERKDIHQIFAGVDFGIWRSDYPVSGISLLRGLKYGVVPVTYDVNGVKELLRPISKQNHDGDSIIIEKLTQDNVFKTIRFAIKLFSKKDIWEKVVINTLKSSLSWSEVANAYVAEYLNCSDL